MLDSQLSDRRHLRYRFLEVTVGGFEHIATLAIVSVVTQPARVQYLKGRAHCNIFKSKFPTCVHVLKEIHRVYAEDAIALATMSHDSSHHRLINRNQIRHCHALLLMFMIRALRTVTHDFTCAISPCWAACGSQDAGVYVLVVVILTRMHKRQSCLVHLTQVSKHMASLF